MTKTKGSLLLLAIVTYSQAYRTVVVNEANQPIKAIFIDHAHHEEAVQLIAPKDTAMTESPNPEIVVTETKPMGKIQNGSKDKPMMLTVYFLSGRSHTLSIAPGELYNVPLNSTSFDVTYE